MSIRDGERTESDFGDGFEGGDGNRKGNLGEFGPQEEVDTADLASMRLPPGRYVFRTATEGLSDYPGEMTGLILDQTVLTQSPTPPPIICFDREANHPYSFGMLSSGEIKAALREGRKTTDVLLLVVRSPEEGLIQILRNEIPMKRRPALQLTMLVECFIASDAFDMDEDRLHEKLGVRQEDLRPFESLINLCESVRDLLRDGRLSEAAAVCVSGIMDHRDQKRIARRSIKKRWSLQRLQTEIADTCELLTCRDCTLSLWDTLPHVNGSLGVPISGQARSGGTGPGTTGAGGAQ
jgi:hypothetical protein